MVKNSAEKWWELFKNKDTDSIVKESSKESKIDAVGDSVEEWKEWDESKKAEIGIDR